MFAGSPVLLQCSNIRTIWPLHIRSRCSCSANFHHLWLRPPVRFRTHTSAGGNRTAHYWKVNNKHVRTIKKIALDVFIAGYLIQFRRMRSTICCTPSQICIFRPWGGLSQALLLRPSIGQVSTSADRQTLNRFQSIVPYFNICSLPDL